MFCISSLRNGSLFQNLCQVFVLFSLTTSMLISHVMMLSLQWSCTINYVDGSDFTIHITKAAVSKHYIAQSSWVLAAENKFQCWKHFSTIIIYASLHTACLQFMKFSITSRSVFWVLSALYISQKPYIIIYMCMHIAGTGTA